jgi:flagellar motor switch protein FliM
MASDTLSQNEIDALLNRGAAAATAIEPASREPDHVIYDFRRPHRISKDRLRTIEAMYERLAKSLEAWLLSRLRRQIELRLQSVEQYSFGEFTLSLSTPCASFGFDIKNFEGQKGVIDIGHELAFLVVDRFFGGDAQPISLQRGLTPIERMTVRVLIERVSSLLREIWQDHVPLDLELTSFESFPEMVQAGNREDPVLVANIEVAGEGLRSLLIICLPLGVLEKFFAEGDGRRVKQMTGSAAERQATRQITEASLRNVPVDVSARLPSFDVTLRELMSVGEGGVLATGISTDTPVQLMIGGRPRFVGLPGRIGQRVAFQVTDALTNGDAVPAAHPPTAFTPEL